MISEAWIDYLNEHILLKDEELNLIDIDENNGFVDIPVIKRTARTRRIVAKLTLGLQNTRPPEDLLKTFTSPKVKKQLTISDETYDWIRNGWVIREYRLERDERSVKSEQYRMGFTLFQLQAQVENDKKRENKELLLEWRNNWEKIKQTDKCIDSPRSNLLRLLENKLEAIAGEGQKFVEDKINKFESANATWRFQKRLLFFHFLLALYEISLSETHFDWKQIGARYFRKIGGSKEFDAYKKEFIEEAEGVMELPLQLVGLTSLGTITPIFFTGPMTGKNVNYGYGSIHATTDLAVFTDEFKTNAEVLWLVENRGVLTRMAYDHDFLVESNSFVLGIDGQLRSAHRKLIENLVSCVKQVIVWTDVDEAGFTIAKELSNLSQRQQVKTKWVVPPLEVVTDYQQFEGRYKQSIEARKEEQEQEIGGVEHWVKWIKT